MQQTSLFDVPQPPALLPTPERVNRSRDVAMARVAQRAEEQRPDFGSEARGFVLRYLAAHGPTSGEVLSLQCKGAGIVPHDDRAFGPVYYQLSKRGLIVKVGEARRERGHGTAGGNIWALPRN